MAPCQGVGENLSRSAAVGVVLSGGLLGWKRPLLQRRKAPIFVTGHDYVAPYTDSLAQSALSAAEHLRSLGVAVLFSEIRKRDTAHGDVLNVITRPNYDRRYC